MCLFDMRAERFGNRRPYGWRKLLFTDRAFFYPVYARPQIRCIDLGFHPLMDAHKL